MANSVDPDIGAVHSGYTVFAYILNSSVMFDNYLQRMTSADDIFICIFFTARNQKKELNLSNTWCVHTFTVLLESTAC